MTAEETALADVETPDLPGATLTLMTISVGVIVANIYYAQPLLADIARGFGLSVTSAGAVAMLSQIGSALGMLFFVPLGDVREKRGLIATLVAGAAVALALTAAAPNALWLSLSMVTVGLTASTVHVIVPFAAQLAPPHQRGRAVGMVLSGVLFGILLARTFSGFVGAAFGWRAVYWVASLAMALLALLLRVRLPRSDPHVTLSWPEMMRSIGRLVRDYPPLREAALLGALFFAAFSAFWTTLTFLLQAPPYHYGSSVAGLFGLVGAAGAAGAPFVGRMADRHGPRRTVLLGLVLTLASFVVLGLFGKMLAGLIVGVLLLDLGVQSGHVSNQTRIYGLLPSARSRLNTVYMVSYFVGGACGSYFGALCWRLFGWWGVCAFGIAALCVGIGIHAGGRRGASGADATQSVAASLPNVNIQERIG